MLVGYHVGCTADEDQLTADLMPYVVSEEGQAAAAEVAGVAGVAGAAPNSGALHEQARMAIDAISTAS